MKKRYNLVEKILSKGIQTTVVDVYPSTTDKIIKFIDDHFKCRIRQMISFIPRPKKKARMYVRG